MKTPSFPCVFNVDRHRLSQVVHNLVSNAIKFSAEESTVKVSVDVISGDSAENTSHDLHMQNKQCCYVGFFKKPVFLVFLKKT